MRKFENKLFLLGLLWALIDAPRLAMSAEATAPIDVELAKSLFAGLRTEREKLRQGVVRGSGRKIETASLPPIDSPIEFLYAFDWDAGRLRCDRTEQWRVISASDGMSPADAAAQGPGDLRMMAYSYIRVPGKSVVYHRPQGDVRGGSVQTLNADMQPPMRAFDLRAVGLIDWQGYVSQRPYEKCFTFFDHFAPTELVEEREGLYRMEWIVADGAHRVGLWIDRKQGFAPVRQESSDRRIPANKGTGHRPFPPPNFQSEATWERLNGVWVPKTYRIEQRMGGPGSGKIWRYEHVFSWESVNTLPPDSLFTAEDFGIAKGSAIIDYRGQRPIIERVIGMPDSPHVGEVLQEMTPSGPPETLGWSAGRKALVVAGLAFGAVLLVSAVAAGVRRRHCAASTRPDP